MSSCSYIELFHNGEDRVGQYEIVDDFLFGRDFIHWQKKYIDSENIEIATKLKINYKILFQPSPYNLNFIVKEYLDNIRILKNLRGLNNPLSKEEHAKYLKFLSLNDWTSFFKKMMKYYKVYGDVFIAYTLKTVEGYGQIPMLKILNPADVEIRINKKTKEKEYLYKIKRTIPREAPGNPTETVDEEEDIILIIKKGEIIPMVNLQVVPQDIVTLPEIISDYTPMIHLQYMKQDDCEYSIIPAVDFLDTILRLHRIETNISEINDKSGNPQIFVTDGDVDPNSRFGARCIAYIDTSVECMGTSRQAKITQLEITNGLEPLYEERKGLIDALFNSANLIPPSMKEIYAKSDSSKIVKFLSMDLVNEQRIAYETIADQLKPIFKVLFPDRIDEDITLQIPRDLGMSSLLDKATYVNSNVMTIREMLEEEGLTDTEIESHMTELKEQISILANTSLVPTPTTDKAEQLPALPLEDNATPTRQESAIEKPDGLDNRDKK